MPRAVAPLLVVALGVIVSVVVHLCFASEQTKQYCCDDPEAAAAAEWTPIKTDESKSESMLEMGQVLGGGIIIKEEPPPSSFLQVGQ